MRRPVLTLLLLATLTFLLGLGRQAITDSDEGFYAEASREMVEGGDWLTPHFNYEDRWQKPILYYWATALVFVVGGVNEFTARATAATAGIGLVLLTWAAARRFTGREDAAWIAGAVVASCYGCFALARTALPDLPLAFFITATIVATLVAAEAEQASPIRWWAIAGLASGFGFLTKGPLGLVVPAVVLLPIWWRERQTLTVTPRGVFAAAVAFALSGLPWYIAMTVEHGQAYLQSFFLADNLERFGTTRFNEPRGFWFYLPVVAGGLLPWTPYLLVVPANSFREVFQGRRRLSKVEWRLLWWALAPLLLFTLSIGKQPRYILPLLPPLATFLGLLLAQRLEAARQRPAQMSLSIATYATAVIFAALASLVFRARPLFVTTYPVVTWAGIVGVGGAGLVLAWIATVGAWSRLPAVMAASAVVLLLTLQFGAFAGRRPEAVEQIAAMLQANRQPGEAVAEYDVLVRNLVFYTGFQHQQVFDDAGALAFLDRSERVFLVLQQEDLDRLQSLTDAPLHTVGTVTSLNVARVRVRTLLAPRPNEDLDTIVVVSNR